MSTEPYTGSILTIHGNSYATKMSHTLQRPGCIHAPGQCTRLGAGNASFVSPERISIAVPEIFTNWQAGKPAPQRRLEPQPNGDCKHRRYARP